MHIAELAQIREIDRLYRCDSMPTNRWYLFGWMEGDVYLRADGTMEPFAWRVDNDKYRDDETWADCGPVVRLDDGSLDLSALPVAA